MSRQSRFVQLQQIFCLLLMIIYYGSAARCRFPDGLLNGRARTRSNVVRIQCNYGSTLIGQQFYTCDFSGRLSGERPVCAKAGCLSPISPENGDIEIPDDRLSATVTCNENFVVAGNARAFCDGHQWDRQLGVCRLSNHTLDHACDFETVDLCGWTHTVALGPQWKRVATASNLGTVRTGPPHDHTLQKAYGGHYMLLESGSGTTGAHHLISPIYARSLSLKTKCCFRFHYFMYGEGVGTLTVLVKPHKLHTDEMWQKRRSTYAKFSLSGTQGKTWQEHTISIDEMPDDFQIIFTASDMTNVFGDIAIDDVRLMVGRECGADAETTTTEQPVEMPPDEQPPDAVMSCAGRCYDGYVPDRTIAGKLIMGCSCNEECTDAKNCCPDYAETCFATTVDPATEATTTPSTTTTTRATTTTTTTTTTRTTPPTTTTTTTRATAPITKSTTTTRTTPSTTSTTRRSTTITTTSTTTSTTTRIPPHIAPVTSTSTTRAPAAKATKPNKIVWTVKPTDIEGDELDRNATSPVRFMWISLLVVLAVIIVANFVYRCRPLKNRSIGGLESYFSKKSESCETLCVVGEEADSNSYVQFKGLPKEQ